MNKTAQVGNWSFEAKQIFCRKTQKHGEPYAASAVITITDGVPHVELLTSNSSDKFTREDRENLKAFIIGLGFDSAHNSRFKDSIKKDREQKA
jgi:hypothetical protein